MCSGLRSILSSSGCYRAWRRAILTMDILTTAILTMALLTVAATEHGGAQGGRLTLALTLPPHPNPNPDPNLPTPSLQHAKVCDKP